MTYQAVDQLTYDPVFGGRVRACSTTEARTFADSEDSEVAALADGILRGESTPLLMMNRLVGSAPGLADQADSGETFDQSQVTDGDILAAVQAQWPVAAELLYGPETL